MKAERLIVRCYAERKDSQWQALCLDFCLASQADTFDEAIEKLDLMIYDYVYDALEGEDKEFAESFLLNRRAPFKYWAKYYFYSALSSCGYFL